jgi:hypothetical protein
MEKMVQQMAQGAGWFRLERGRGIRMDELCNLPEAIRGELESVSSSRMLLPSSSEPRPGVSWSEMIGLSPVFFVPVRRRRNLWFVFIRSRFRGM